MVSNSPNALTVKRLIQDLQTCGQDNEVTVVIHGIGITIPINGIMQLNADDKDIVMLTIQKENVDMAINARFNSEDAN